MSITDECPRCGGRIVEWDEGLYCEECGLNFSGRMDVFDAQVSGPDHSMSDFEPEEYRDDEDDSEECSLEF